MDEIEQLRQQLADARASETSLRDVIAERTRERDAAAAEREAARSESEGLRGNLTAAVGKYRESVLSADASLGGAADLIAGDSIEAVDASVERARGIVARVKDEVEKANQARGVPNGGTTRQPESTEGMTPAERLRFGVAATIAKVGA